MNQLAYRKFREEIREWERFAEDLEVAAKAEMACDQYSFEDYRDSYRFFSRLLVLSTCIALALNVITVVLVLTHSFGDNYRLAQTSRNGEITDVSHLVTSKPVWR